MDRLEIKGKVNTAICYAKVVEEEAIEQIRRMCDYEFTEGAKIRVMPDVHAGKGCTIGTTMTITDKVVSNIVGGDLGCGMLTVNIGKNEIDLKKLDEAAHYIPSGMDVWEGRQECFDLEKLRCYRELKDTKRLNRSLGTLGGGNHFLEVDIASDGTKYLVIHTGSRNLGKQVAEICQRFAKRNRELIAEILLQRAELKGTDAFHTIHNYIDTEEMILRKGAIAAHKGEKVLIPINMRDGSVLAMGKGNAEWNYSAPHGAGRIMSRSKAKTSLDLEEYKKAMSGIYTTSVNEATLDEAPMAYKRLEDIIDVIKESVDVIDILKPIYNFKAN